MSGLSLGQTLPMQSSFTQIANGLAQGLGLFQDLANQYQSYNQHMFSGSVSNNATPQQSLSRQAHGSLSQLSADAAEFFTTASLQQQQQQQQVASTPIYQLSQQMKQTPNIAAPGSPHHGHSVASPIPFFQLPNPG